MYENWTPATDVIVFLTIVIIAVLIGLFINKKGR